jgi:hypothetical protein
MLYAFIFNWNETYRSSLDGGVRRAVAGNHGQGGRDTASNGLFDQHHVITDSDNGKYMTNNLVVA